MCVIGSGITGVSAVWHLVEGLKKRAVEGEGEGLDIVVLEARDFCEFLFLYSFCVRLDYVLMVRFDLDKVLELLVRFSTIPTEVYRTDRLATTPKGRNGGHLAEDTFSSFRRRISALGLRNALRAIQIESYTTSAIASIIHTHNLVEKVDLVEEGRVSLQFDEEWMEGRRRDWEEARRKGVEVGSVRWFSEQEMREVSLGSS